LSWAKPGNSGAGLISGEDLARSSPPHSVCAERRQRGYISWNALIAASDSLASATARVFVRTRISTETPVTGDPAISHTEFHDTKGSAPSPRYERVAIVPLKKPKS